MLGNYVSLRARNLETSPTMLLDSKAKAMIANGEDVINFSVGEPHFAVPEHVKEAIKKALDENFTKYTAAGGIPELKEAICRKLNNENAVKYNLENIVVSTGAKQSLFNAFLATIDDRDEVLIPCPYWVSFPEMVKMAGGIPKIVYPSNGLRVTADDIRYSINYRTKMLILNSPNNPTGEVYSKKELEEIADVAVKNELLVISDEIYERLIYETDFYSIASLNEDIKNQTITINGLSKSFSMTGLRLGYAAAPKDIAVAMTKIQTQSTSSPTSIIQKGAVAALTMNNDFLTKRVKILQERKETIVKSLRSIPGLNCTDPSGAFYVFPDVSGLYNENIQDSMTFSEYMLEKAKIAVVPGKPFGDDRCVRISYALPLDKIEEGMKRFKKALGEI